MRISTSQYFASSVSGYSKGYSDITKTQEQISSGVRIQTAADDPVGAARLLQLQQQQAMLSQYSANMNTATNSLNQEESVLTSITNVLQSARTIAVQAGDGSLTDEDRQALSDQLGQLQDQLYTLMNSKDASGNYIFAGSKTSVQPFVKNADGTYSYQGDQSTLALQVSDSLNISTNDNGWTTFETATNASRTTSSVSADPSSDGVQRVYMSQGTVSVDSTYNASYRSGAPYTVEIVDSTHYKVYDTDGNDITGETGTLGVWDASSSDSNSVSFRGATFQLDTSLASTDDSAEMDDLVSGYTFSLGTAANNFSTIRSATNTSSAQITGSGISDNTAYTTQFPANGVSIQFTSATGYAVYSLPTSTTATPIATGTLGATFPQTINVAGVDLSISAAPASGDQFTVTTLSSEKQNILNTLGQLRSALENTSTDDPQAQLNLRDTVASALNNLDNGMKQVDRTVSSVGARLSSIDLLSNENQSISLTNTATQSSIRDTDMAAATSQLVLQQTMLEAAQAAFARVSQLSLFDKL